MIGHFELTIRDLAAIGISAESEKDAKICCDYHFDRFQNGSISSKIVQFFEVTRMLAFEISFGSPSKICEDPIKDKR